MFDFKDFIRKRLDVDIDENENLSNFIFENMKNYFKKSGSLIIILIVISIIIYYAATDSQALTKNTLFYIMIIILPLLIGIYLSTNILNDENLIKIFLVFIILIIFSIIGFYFSNASSSTINIINYLFYILVFFIIIISLALFYYSFSDYLQNQTGSLGFIINFIFYIPCLFSEFLLYLKTQAGITPSIVYILFLLEIFLILIYIYLPKLIKSYGELNSIVLLNDPVYLDVELPIVKDKDIFLLKDNETMKINTSEKIISYRNSNYSFSFWVFINPGSKSKIEYMKETNIFYYGNNNKGKPRITSMNDPVDPFKQKFIVYFTNNVENTDKTNYEIYLPIQKWNNFVFNYSNNSADLFINGVLEKSFNFDHDNIPLDGNSNDDVFIGSNNGINGSICNIKYYTFIQTTSQIAYEYNSLMFSNPPIYTSE